MGLGEGWRHAVNKETNKLEYIDRIYRGRNYEVKDTKKGARDEMEIP